MNQTFHFSRIWLLFVRFITENWRRDVISLAAYFIAFALLPRINMFSFPQLPFVLFCIILFIGGIHFSAHIFHEIHRPSSGMHYIHIPASRVEKFFVNGALTLLIFPLLCFLLFYAATLFGNLIEPIMPSILNYKTIDISTLFPSSYTGKTVEQFVLVQAIFFLGALIFKKHPTTKTIISVIAFGVVIGVVQIPLAQFLWSNSEVELSLLFKGGGLQIGGNIFDSTVLKYADQIFNYIIVIFLWVVSYFKLKEKEV